MGRGEGRCAVRGRQRSTSPRLQTGRGWWGDVTGVGEACSRGTLPGQQEALRCSRWGGKGTGTSVSL